MSFVLRGRRKEFDLGFLDGEIDQTIDKISERFVIVESFLDLVGAVSTDEATDRFASMYVSEVVVWAMPTRVLRIHATTASTSTDLVLHGNASWVDGIQIH